MKRLILTIFVLFLLPNLGFSTVYYYCGTGITWDAAASDFLYTASDCSGTPVNPNTLTSADEMVIQAGADILIVGSITFNGIKITVFGTIYINKPALAGKLTLPENLATIVFEAGSNLACWDGAAEAACDISASQIIIGTGANKFTYKGADIDEMDDLPKPSFLDAFGGSLPLPMGPGGVGYTDGTSNLSLWLNASTITGISDGADMSGTWDDQSGNGYDAVIENGAPSYSATGGGNGQPALTFDSGNNESMEVAGNPEILPTSEISVFVAGNYENASNSWAAFVFTSDDDDWDDGWGIAEENNTGEFNMWVDHYQNGGCLQNISSDYGTDHVWTLIFNTTDDLVYGYKSENTACTDAFTGPINYDTGGNDNLLIGVSRAGTPNLTGDIEQIIVYDVAVNDAQRIIISNYLAAKYAISLTNNDVYNEDDNGDYDFEVAGIGRVDNSNIHDDAQGPGIVRILNPSGLGNDEFLMWGHDNGVALGTETTDVPGGVDARLDRVWRVSEVDASGTGVDVGGIDIRFDLTGMGSITETDLRLLIDADGTFSTTDHIISGATYRGANIYEFTGVTNIQDNDRFTLGTADASQTPLPIELLSFSASVTDKWEVQLDWQTASETNNDYFTIEKSKDAEDWRIVNNIDATGNSTQLVSYTNIDENPYPGISYYRLKQTDFDGQYSYSEIRLVNIDDFDSSPISIYPNPTGTQITIEGSKEEIAKFRIYNLHGQDVSSLIKEVESSDFRLTLDISNLRKGMYLIKTSTTVKKIFKQ